VSGFIFVGNTSHWQRILSAESPLTARNSHYYLIPILAVYSVLMLNVGLYGVATVETGTAETVLFTLIRDVLPPVVVGVEFAAILAVIMSSIDS
ncbi:MAG: hypothetical protein ABEI52_06400, partial [Halobacteriaceae archaeon]